MRFLAIASILCSLTIFTESGAASSGTVCTSATTGADRIEISWGSTRGIGSPRFGAVAVAIGEQKFKLWSYPLTPLESAAESGVKNFETKEVGYWSDSKRLMVHITDDQLTFSMLQIEAESAGDVFKGQAVTRIYADGRTRKVEVRCSKE